MSSKKDCGNHEREKLHRGIFACLVGFIILVLFIVLVVWLVLRPAKPRFLLQDASVLQFNLTAAGSSLLTSVIQVTISSRNPNDRVGVYYDRLDVYAVYRDQQISLSTSIPPSYQGHNDVAVWSPYLYGAAVPVAPYVAAALSADEAAGFLVIYVRIDGRVRWKVGDWISGHYHLDVSCPAFLSFAKEAGDSPAMRFRQLSTCSVDV